MNTKLPDGVWPVMLTPFADDGSVDYETLDVLTDWYVDQGADGLFAVCLSSEMYNLSLDERVAIALRVVKRVSGRIPVIASGHVSESFANQIKELEQIAQSGVEAVVLSTNKISNNEDGIETWKKNINRIVDALPSDMAFGLYECPVPFKKILSVEELQFCEQTGRFLFLKDTSCDIDIIRNRLSALNGELKIFNANAATLHESLQSGASGYCGIMSNLHPALYKKAYEELIRSGSNEELFFDLISTLSLAEYQNYPLNAKLSMNLSGVPISFKTRNKKVRSFPASQRLEVEKMHRLVQYSMKNL